MCGPRGGSIFSTLLVGRAADHPFTAQQIAQHNSPVQQAMAPTGGVLALGGDEVLGTAAASAVANINDLAFHKKSNARP